MAKYTSFAEVYRSNPDFSMVGSTVIFSKGSSSLTYEIQSSHLAYRGNGGTSVKDLKDGSCNSKIFSMVGYTTVAEKDQLAKLIYNRTYICGDFPEYNNQTELRNMLLFLFAMLERRSSIKVGSGVFPLVNKGSFAKSLVDSRGNIVAGDVLSVIDDMVSVKLHNGQDFYVHINKLVPVDYGYSSTDYKSQPVEKPIVYPPDFQEWSVERQMKFVKEMSGAQSPTPSGTSATTQDYSQDYFFNYKTKPSQDELQSKTGSDPITEGPSIIRAQRGRVKIATGIRLTGYQTRVDVSGSKIRRGEIRIPTSSIRYH